MHIHEYQAKRLLGEYGIATPEGFVATSAADARAAARNLPGTAWVVKAQIHAGGRGKGGGIKVCESLDEVERAAAELVGMKLVTPQTGPKGRKVNQVWVERGVSIAREFYLAAALDRGAGVLAVIASPDGGVDIEETAARHPERIFRILLDGAHHIWPFQARRLLFACGLGPERIGKGVSVVNSLLALCVDKDALQAEINPLALTVSGDFIALDAKIDFDESALKRRPEIAALADPAEEDPLERQAAALGVNYVRLDGYVGTMVNGAGLAMATMDAVRQAGAEPANFLDAGGGADAEMVRKGFEIMLSDPNVRGVLVNIFGGILRCDIVAEGIARAAEELEINLPVVIRMEGTNVEEARRILNGCGLNFTTAANMDEAARLIAERTMEIRP